MPHAADLTFPVGEGVIPTEIPAREIHTPGYMSSYGIQQ